MVKPFQKVLHKSLKWLLPQVWLVLDEPVGESCRRRRARHANLHQESFRAVKREETVQTETWR